MTIGSLKLVGIRCTIAILAAWLPVVPATAQTQPTMERTAGVWVEGPGFDITYGGTYDQCTARCLANSTCVMVEYYRPEKKCNMYTAVRPLKTGGDSIVGIKKPAKLPTKP
jgi:PAN-like domain